MNNFAEYDNERAVFEQEMHEEESAGWLATFATRSLDAVSLMPRETRVSLASLRKMVRNRNEMVKLLREFLTLQSEDTELTRRARRFTD